MEGWKRGVSLEEEEGSAEGLVVKGTRDKRGGLCDLGFFC